MATCLMATGCTSAAHPAQRGRPALSSAPSAVGSVPPAHPGGARHVPSARVLSGRVFGPWRATTVGGSIGRAIPLLGSSRSLYLRAGRNLVRVDARSKRVEAVRPVPYPAMTLVAGGGRLWMASTVRPTGELGLQGLDPRSLRTVARIRLHGVASPADSVALAADARGRLLYVGAGKTVFVVAPRTGRIVTRYRAPGGRVTSLALSPSRERLYLTTSRSRSAMSRMAAIDPRTGEMVTPPVVFDDYATVLAATAGGAWVAGGSGHTLTLTFRPADDLARPDRQPVTSGGGGFGVDSTVQDGVVWIGGSTTLACADPATGRIRARARVPSPQHDAANINFLVVAGHRLFGYYLADAGPTSLLIQLTPPAACR
jgi:hypothetical protein